MADELFIDVKMAEPKTVLCFGDSNTWGHDPDADGRRFSRNTRWPIQMQKLLGNDFVVIEEGLNARTTVFEDPIGPCHASYSCNGRGALPVILHTHKPVDIVIVALGTNDLKQHFAASPAVIVKGLKALVDDIQRHQLGGDQPPKIIVCGPPRVKETATSLEWGFQHAAASSETLASLVANYAEQVGIGYVDFGAVAQVSDSDGVHFPLEAQLKLARACAEAVKSL
eukprot:TRINITY_DN9738_c0_g3_i2.p1 TRINITY_DN9738_c0_g3~~TRINITY_DN9738_c0_g3_i2.p1  ORF type:complete len:226 (+),score=24.96 TRINITY_DN9738_c0_g3_i2:137-814(+)